METTHEDAVEPTRSSPAASAAGVSVVLPVHANAAALPELCGRLRAALGRRRLEIVMVDDASPDDSLAVMQKLDVTVVSRSRRGGQNAAILSGLRQAREPITCVMDADLQDPPEAVPRLLERLAAGDARVVFSTRETRSPPTSRLFRWTLRRIFPSLPKTPCLFFAMDAGVRDAMLDLASERDYLVAVVGALGVPTAAVSVPRERRRAGRSAYGSWRRVRYATSALGSAVRLRLRTMAHRSHA